MVPFEAASKHSNGGMIWPPGKTSIRNRPPLVSSTIVASRRAALACTSSAGGKAVDIRHWIFGCAMTYFALGSYDRLKPMMPGFIDVHFAMDWTSFALAAAVAVFGEHDVDGGLVAGEGFNGGLLGDGGGVGG